MDPRHPGQRGLTLEKSVFQIFAFSIVIQAMRDYQTAFQALKKNPNNKAAQSNLDEVMTFFNSKWYRCLTDIPGEVLMQMVEDKKGPIKIYQIAKGEL